MGLQRLILIFLLGALMALVSVVLAASGDQAARQHELEQVRQRIEQLRHVIETDVRKRDSVTARLRDIERLLGSVRSNLARLRTERESSEARHAALLVQKAARERDLQSEQAALSGQLKSAWLNGRQERLKMLLNQSDAATIGRQSVYYRYLARSRVERIEVVETHLEELKRIELAVSAENQRLKDLELRRSDEAASLETAVSNRRNLIAKLKSQIDAKDNQLGALQTQEAALVKLLADLERVLAEFPVQSQQPFVSLKGKLAWPVNGALLGDFGQPRAGPSMKWNGVLIAAERGAPVRAVAHGRVAYADWLPGLGLLIVIEHGSGYLSLYGHNERLDAGAGDWVDAGDTIATVGDSGGQPVAALYFEIRRERRPLNPHPWFSKGLVKAP